MKIEAQFVKGAKAALGPTLGEVVQECALAHQDIEEAARELLRKVSGNQALYHALVGSYEWAAATLAIRNARRVNRSGAWNSSGAQAANDRVHALARANAATFLSFPLPGGPLLSDAQKSDVLAAAKFYLSSARDMAWKGKWLEIIASRMADEKKVGEQFDEATLAAIKAEVATC